MPKTLGTAVNSALKVIGESEVTSFTSGNILEELLIEEANNGERDILNTVDYEWGLKHTTLVTTDNVSTESVAVTNASTTVTSVTSAGANAQNFGSVTTSMWFRVTSDQTSYEISSVDSVSNPHTITLAVAYKGTTSTAIGYDTFQDTYSLSDSDLDEVQYLTYGLSGHGWALSRWSPDRQVHPVNFNELMERSGGDLHRVASGRPAFFSRLSRDSSDNPRILLWPYPDDDYLMDVWYTILYSENTTFDTNLFAGDAPEIAYDAVESRMKWRAFRYENMHNDAAEEWALYERGLGKLVKRENDTRRDQSPKVATFRRGARGRYPVRSLTAFDNKSAKRW
jgi:hypothetical protein